MLIDMHTHTRAISHCCRVYAEKAFERAIENGFDALVITNHYTNAYFFPEEHEAWIEKYIEEWNACRELGKKMGIKVFCGIEVTMECAPMVHMLIYGADEDFLRNHKFLCEMSHEELYKLCKSYGYALVQAHPFRRGGNAWSTEFLDGVEINCHPLYKTSSAKEVIEVADSAGLALTCGCDYHADTYRPKGGMIIPDSISSDMELAQYILNEKKFTLKVHEPENNEIYILEYNRK